MHSDRHALWDYEAKTIKGCHTHRIGSLRRFVAVFEGCQPNPSDCHRYPKAANKVCVGSHRQPSAYIPPASPCPRTPLGQTSVFVTGSLNLKQRFLRHGRLDVPTSMRYRRLEIGVSGCS
jgi:hypothetical protein